jgi:AraC family transcriptional regulator of adaptative response / DNA-3-methyladenine glycosylase II
MTTGVRLELPAPYDVPWLTWYLSAHAVPGVESFADGRYAAALRTPDGPDVVSIDLASRPGSVVVRSRRGRPSAWLLTRVRALLDLDTDGAAVAAHLGSDPQLAPAVARAPGIRVPGALDGWELLLRTMLGQQISLAAARTHLARLVAALGEPVDGAAGWRLVPTAATVARDGTEALTGPRARVEAVVGAAAAVADGSLDLGAGRDPAELRAELLRLRGVGPWTAAYMVMRLARDPDVLLTSDLVVRQGAEVLGADLSSADWWSPYRSYATMHLWRAALAARPRHTSPFSNDSMSAEGQAEPGRPDVGPGP